ncbi:TolC family protein [Derxia lacustris]|uniref:TolC family protein n=1 Tax=Derxia lacustris TaxID=764842 RepID=UPI000A1753AF|nr:TolC family protein [Derxia lacustris]
MNDEPLTGGDGAAPARGGFWRELLALGIAVLAALPVQAAPLDLALAPADRLAALGATAVKPVLLAPTDARGAEARLQALATLAANRSALVAASEHDASASKGDADEAAGARYPRIDASARAAFAGADTPWLGNGRQVSAGLSASLPLVDFGRQRALEDWRRRLADAAELGADATREAVALEAVNLALERNRARAQLDVQRQYADRLADIAARIAQIVALDRGRASELVQARKSQLQAEIGRDAALAALRQTETRLRRFIGDDLAPAEDIAPAFANPIAPDELPRLARNARDQRQLRAQAAASERYADAVAAGQQPQIGLVAGRSLGRNGELAAGSWTAGVQMSVTLFNGRADAAARSAALERARAAEERANDALAARETQLLDLADSAAAARERARAYADVLRASDEVRTATFQQWAELGRRSLFDVMSAEGDHAALHAAYLNALYDSYAAQLRLRALGTGLLALR